MKKITLSGTTATVEEVSLVGFLTGSVINPFVGQPLTAAQAGIFGGVCFVGGAAAFWAFGDKTPMGRKKKENDVLQRTFAEGPTNNSIWS